MRIAAVGDSVMWGQGLVCPKSTSHFKDEQKFVFKIVEWLKNEGKVQSIDMADFLAHSGAKIGSATDPLYPPKLPRIKADSKIDYDNYYGEIPDRNPAILWQLKKLRDGNAIDLLLINGGPNDVEITESISPIDPITKNFNEALKKIDRVADLRVSLLLSEARKACPNAIIIYTGYYPALSPRSDIPLDISLTAILGPVSLVFGFWGVLFIPDLLIRTQFPRIKEQGVLFHQRMLAKFREQIALFNEKRNPASLPILFCPSLFSSLNAMWGNDEMIFSLGGEQKSVSILRKKLCEQVSAFENANLSYDDRLICENANIGHPNTKGAEQYFKQLKKRIEIQLSFSLRDHFEKMDSQVLSIRNLKEKYPFISISSLRGLSDFYWMDVIAVDCNIKVNNPLLLEHARIFLETVYFDFGWGYRRLNGENGRFVMELSDNRRINALKFLKIRYNINVLSNSPLAKMSNISLDVVIQINGYQLCALKLTRNSFKISGVYLVWEMPTLNFK